MEYLAIDLGLPSGLKWANMNVGASKPEENGKYFAWGDVEGTKHVGATSFKGKFTRDWYNTLPAHDLINDITPTSGYDAARVNMGLAWRMPTKANFEELLANTTQTVETINGVKGVKFTSKVSGNSNFIFIPFAGNGHWGHRVGLGDWFNLWSSSFYTSDTYTQRAWNLNCYGYGCRCYLYRRHQYYGISVRGVCE